MGFLERAEDAEGYPAWGFEAFYQQGIACFVWGLPKPLVRQAFKKVCHDWLAKVGPVAMWQVRAFVYGLHGKSGSGVRERRVPEGFRWPTPPDPSWELVVCVYPDGECDLDLLHPVSGRFWTEDNGFFPQPTEDRLQVNRYWYEEMGFDILLMQPTMQVQVAEPQNPHLKLV